MSREINRLDSVDRKQTAEPTVETGTSESVEWRDISVDTDRATETDAQSGSASDRIQVLTGEPLTIETGDVTATLVGVPQAQIDDLIYAHQRNEIVSSTYTCALFDVENTSNAPIHWISRRTKFIGSDGYTYKQANLSLNPSRLGAGCFSRQVKIEPGCRARIITLVEQLPPGVDVKKVIHTISPRGRLGNQRLAFSL